MTKKVKTAKKSTGKADKTPEVTKAAKALENYLKENNLDPAKDWSKDKTHGKAVKELVAKLNKERDKVAAKYPEKDEANQAKLVKLNQKSAEAKAKKEKERKEKKEKDSSTGRKPTKYDYPLIDGREMTSDEKKKYRVEQRRLASGKATKPSEEKPKSKEKEEVKKETTKTKKVKKEKKASKEED